MKLVSEKRSRSPLPPQIEPRCLSRDMNCGANLERIPTFCLVEVGSFRFRRIRRPMSAAEHQSPDVSSQASDPSLPPPPRRPSLRQPPLRPEPAPTQPTSPKPEMPARPAVTAAPATPPTQTPAAAPAPPPPTNPNHPIAPPSEPMQYRAIGLV